MAICQNRIKGKLDCFFLPNDKVANFFSNFLQTPAHFSELFRCKRHIIPAFYCSDSIEEKYCSTTFCRSGGNSSFSALEKYDSEYCPTTSEYGRTSPRSAGTTASCSSAASP